MQPSSLAEESTMAQSLHINDSNSVSTSMLGNSTADPLTTSNASEYSYYEYEYYPEGVIYIDATEVEVVALGYIRPILVLITTFANFFVVGFFMTKKNRRLATNLLFVSIAFSDTMTGLVLLPNTIYIYMLKNDVLSQNWCHIAMLTKFYFSRVFHTVSIWQTVVLGIQRYMCVCHPFISSRVCTTGKTFVSIVVMYCSAFLLHLYHAVDDKITEETHSCEWGREEKCSGACLHIWCTAILQHFLPCFILVCLTTITLLELKKAHRRVSSMSHRSTSKRTSRDRIITITTTLVVIVFLVPEFPYGVVKVIWAVSLQWKLEMNPERNHFIIAIYELAVLISFHANFWIYCSMMHDFRHAFFKFITCGMIKRGLTRIRTFSGSISPRKNSVNRTLSCTSSVIGRNRILSQTTSIHSTASDTHHAVVPLTPSKARKADYIRAESMDDDVFV